MNLNTAPESLLFGGCFTAYTGLHCPHDKLVSDTRRSSVSQTPGVQHARPIGQPAVCKSARLIRHCCLSQLTFSLDSTLLLCSWSRRCSFNRIFSKDIIVLFPKLQISGELSFDHRPYSGDIILSISALLNLTIQPFFYSAFQSHHPSFLQSMT